MVSKREGLLGIPELGVWGRGCHSGRDVSPTLRLFYPPIIPISQICSQASSPCPGMRIRFPENRKEKGSEIGKLRLEYSVLGMLGKGWRPQGEQDGLASGYWEDA